MFITTHIIIGFAACGALLALITENYPLEVSRLLESLFDRIEQASASIENSRRARSLRTIEAGRMYRSATIEALTDAG